MEKEAKGRSLHHQRPGSRVCWEDARKRGVAGAQGPVGTRPPWALGWHIRTRVSKTNLTRVLATGWSGRRLPARLPAHPQRWLASGRAI